MLTVWGLQADPNSLIVLKKKKKMNNEDLSLCVCLYIANYVCVQEEGKVKQGTKKVKLITWMQHLSCSLETFHCRPSSKNIGKIR